MAINKFKFAFISLLEEEEGSKKDKSKDKGK